MKSSFFSSSGVATVITIRNNTVTALKFKAVDNEDHANTQVNRSKNDSVRNK